MKKEDILADLREFMKTGNVAIISNLTEKLEKNIMKEFSLKENKSSKVNAIKRLCKVQEKVRPQLGGYNIASDGKYEITDSYRAYRLNPTQMPVLRVGTLKLDSEDKFIYGTYPNLINLFPTYNEEEKVELDIKDILVKHSLRNKKDKGDKSNFYELKSTSFNIKINIDYLKDTLDILGNDLKCSLNEERKPIYFENKNGETGIVLPIVSY